MDYLDPQKKQRKRIQIMIGYVFLGIAIAMATVILVYITSGYDVDRNTGEVIQNGLVYVDSKPESAKIFVNGVEQGNQTDARLILPGGSYDIRLERDGYRTWHRNIRLEGGNVRRMDYPRLVPTELETAPLRALENEPDIVSQSIDKRWVVMAYDGNALEMQVADLESAQVVLNDIKFPIDLVKTRVDGVWNIIEWSDDNKSFLATYTSDFGVEYVVINREKPLESINVEDVLGDVDFDEVALRSRKAELLFIFNKEQQTVSKAALNGVAPILFAENVLQFDSFGEDIIYITQDPVIKENVHAVLKRGEDILVLQSMLKSEEYLIDMSKLGSAFVMGVGSPNEDKIWVYNNPVRNTNASQLVLYPVATTVLRVDSPEELRISANSSVIMVRGGNSFATHEFEEDRVFDFTLEGRLNGNKEFRWLDGRHFTTAIDGVQHVIDYSGDNRYELVESIPGLGSFFNNELDFLFTFSPANEKKDEPSQIRRSFMRTPADR